MQCSPAIHCLIALRFKYSPYHPIQEQTHSPNVINEASHPYKTISKAKISYI
jgi:hypothetical protein